MATALTESPVETGRQHRAGFRPDIEGIRAIAILLVVAFHAGLPIEGGYVGVDVFYVLSGYLITGLMHAEVQQTGGLNFLRFYARRARRLVPAAAVVVVASLLLGLLVYSPLESLSFAYTARWVTAYVGNFHFARSAVDYFRLDSMDPLLHTWSLAVEEQFYVVWPLLFGVATWLGLKRKQPRLAAVGAIAAVSIVSFALCQHFSRTDQPVAFYTSPTRFWQFGLGALATLIPIRLPKVAAAVGALGGAGLIAYAAFTFDNHTVFPGTAAVIPVVGTVVLLVAGAHSSRDVVALVLRNPVMQWIGRHSYAWYLWHWPLIVFVRVARPETGRSWTVAAALVALGAAWLTRVLVEDPIRFHPRLAARPGLSLAVGGAFLVASALVIVGVTVFADHVSRTAEQRPFTIAHNEDKFNASECAVTIRATHPKRTCVLGDTSGTDTMVLFGDSHAAQWVYAADEMAKHHHWKLIVFSKTSCPTADVPQLKNQSLGRVYTECTTWRTESLQQILALHPVLVVSANADIGVPPRKVKILNISLEDWRNGLRKTAETLEAASIPHVVLADTPAGLVDVPVCLSRRAYAPIGRSDCSFPRRGSLNFGGQRAVVDAVVGLPHARVVNMNDLICRVGAVQCPALIDGTVVYQDRHHLSTAFVATISDEFDARVSGGA